MQQGQRQDIALVVQARFPALTELAKKRIAHVKNEETMQQALIAMSTAQTEDEARQYLLTLKNAK